MSKKSGVIFVLASCVVAPLVTIIGYELVKFCKEKKSVEIEQIEVTEESETEDNE